jgi:hypothetical protein
MRGLAGKKRDQNEKPDRKKRQTEHDVGDQSTHGTPPIAVITVTLFEKSKKIPENLENFS